MLLARPRLSWERGAPVPVAQTYCQWHLGDQLIHLNFLRRAAYLNPDTLFEHCCPSEQMAQLEGMVVGLSNVRLHSLERKSLSAVDAWKNREGRFFASPLRISWVKFHLEHFHLLANLLRIRNPIQRETDLLLDYPDKVEGPDLDVLIINSEPKSGQFPNYSDAKFDALIQRLANRGLRVFCTGTTPERRAVQTWPRNLLEIGTLSRKARLVAGTATGPLWATLRPSTRVQKWLVGLDCQGEQLDLPGVAQFQTMDQLTAAVLRSL